MSYEMCIRKAGAEVIYSTGRKYYQGTMYILARVDGDLTIFDVGYGSCSYCDAYQSAFDGWDKDYTDEDYAAFGRMYTNGRQLSFDAAVTNLRDNLDGGWGDDEAEDMMAYLEDNGYIDGDKSDG